MILFNKINIYIFVVLIVAIGCTDSENVSPYQEILNNPPYTMLTDSIKKFPENEELYSRRAILLNQNNLPEPALADFTKAWSIRKDEKYAFGISTLLLEKKPDSAIAFLKNATKFLPGSYLLQLSLARAYDLTNETDQALAVCNQLLEQNPNLTDVLKLKADLLSKKGDTVAAISSLEKAHRLVPNDIELNFMLALKYAETKNPQVLSLCDSLIRLDTSGIHPEPYYYKGIYYENINEKSKALTFFDEAVKHDYNFMEGYIEKGALLFEMKNYAAALKILNLALTISPEYPESYYWIAKCQQALGQKEDARLNYERAYGLDNTFKAAKDSADKLK
jgi:tetratricopeptide (TPR) repeat protein